MRLAFGLLATLFVLFVVPALAALAWWSAVDRPSSWSGADWSSSGVLPPPRRGGEAVVYVMAARTGGLKGALAVHSWIVTKRQSEGAYTRYDKVAWGSPVRRNIRPADGRWYSNEPWIVRAVRGDAAENAIPRIEQAVARYPHAGNGGYRVWPGPNSNSFVAHVLNAVPELDARLPSNATGRDFHPGWASAGWSGTTFYATLGGYAGFAFRPAALELHFLGLVAGLDLPAATVDIPAFGSWSWRVDRAAR